MKRREMIGAMGAALLFAPFWASAQNAGIYTIGWLSPGSGARARGLKATLGGLEGLGYRVGRNLRIEARWGEGSRALNARQAAELEALKPALIVAQGPAIFPLLKIASTTPVVFAFSGDPVEAGAVQSYARPGGRFTGMSFLALDLVGKRVDFLHEILPHVRRLAVISSPSHPGDTRELAVTREAAERHGMEVAWHPLRRAAELSATLQAVAEARAEAVVAHPNVGMMRHADEFAKFSLEHRVPTCSGWAEFAEEGNLFSYGPKLEDGYRHLAYFVDRVLRGAKPDDLPVELPRTVELVLNVRTAKALGLSVPDRVLLRADRLIV
jgi:putative ABC transport system substrate-binding protein